MLFSQRWTFALLLAGFASATVLPLQKRAADIEVTLAAGAASVGSAEDIEIVASITNTGAKAVKLLKYATILDGDLPTSSFTVTKDGKPVPFMGVKLQVDLALLDGSAFTEIAAGATIKVSHKVADTYDFAAAGPGTFVFAPRTDFMNVNDFSTASTATFSELSVVSTGATIQVAKVNAKAPVVKEKRSRNICTNSSKAAQITSSITESKTLARSAVSWISANGASHSLYVAYWGTNSASTITSRFNAVANENSSSRTMDCTDPYGACSGGVIAYTVIATTNIYFCTPFFSQGATNKLCSGTSVASRSVRGGTTLHEVTHAISNTDDVTYGCAADQALTTAQKLRNADNYNCFSTQAYQNRGCA